MQVKFFFRAIAVRNWPEFAARAELRPERTAEIGRFHHLDILPGK